MVLFGMPVFSLIFRTLESDYVQSIKITILNYTNIHCVYMTQCRHYIENFLWKIVSCQKVLHVLWLFFFCIRRFALNFIQDKNVSKYLFLKFRQSLLNKVDPYWKLRLKINYQTLSIYHENQQDPISRIIFFGTKQRIKKFSIWGRHSWILFKYNHSISECAS